jgi:hypothetical protein
MKSRWLVKTVFVAGTSLLLAVPALAAESFVNYPPGANGPNDTAMSFYYFGSEGDIGQFPGTVVQMSCTARPAPDAERECVDGFRPALLTPEAGIHPLIPGTKRAAAQLKSAYEQGKNVLIFGRLYTNSGAILAGDIRVEHGA